MVPGTIRARLLPTNQVQNMTYKPSAMVYYTVQYNGVPINDNVQIGVEIRGSNPNGGPRGYILMAYGITPITEFIAKTSNNLQYELAPENIFAGYRWFFRPFVFFANASIGSTNMMNSGTSEMFAVLKTKIQK